MQALINKSAIDCLPERQRVALISLLVDDDPTIYHLVRIKLLSCGFQACEWLRPHLLSSDPVMRRRALEIVHSLARQNSDELFLDFCLHHGEDLDLESALGLLAQTQYPDINRTAYQAVLDLWASELFEEVEQSPEPEQKLSLLNHYLFKKLQFTGQQHGYQDPESCYLNRVMDKRSGSAITLSVIYILLGRRLQLPLAGVALPGHFVCRYQDPTREIYVDVFRGGKFWTKVECIRQLLTSHHGVHDGYLTPISSRRILLRMCATLHQAYAQLDMVEEAARVQRYLLALAK